MKKMNKYNITLYDLLIIQEFIKIFEGIEFGTILSKSQNFAELITLLFPNLLINSKTNINIEMISTLDKLKNTRIKAIKIFAIPEKIKERILKARIESPKYYENSEKSVSDFFEKNTKLVESISFNKYHFWNNLGIPKELIDSRKLTDYDRKVYSFGTIGLTEAIKITSLIDNTSLIIMTYSINFNNSQTEKTIIMLNELFTPELKKKSRIIYSDNINETYSKELIEYFNENNIQISFIENQSKNLIIEETETKIKNIIEKNNFEKFLNEINFNDLNEKHKILAIKIIIEIYNVLIKDKNCEALENTFNKLKVIESNKILIKKIFQEILKESINMIEEKNTQNQENLINTWTGLILRTCYIVSSENKCNENSEKNFPLLNKEDLIEIQNICLKKNIKELKLIEKQRLIPEELSEIKRKLEFKKQQLKIRKDELAYELMNNKKQKEPNIKVKKFRTLKSNIKEAILPEDFDIIMNNVNFGRTKFEQAKYRLAHIVLKITGGNIPMLKYTNFNQLDNLFNKKTIYIRNKVNEPADLLAYPYVKEIEKYLNHGKEDYLYLKKCQEENNKELYKINKNHPNLEARLRSEIWGYAERSGLDDQLNKQTKEGGNYLKPRKNLTAKSYRRGMAILINFKVGLLEAQAILGFKELKSADEYMKKTLIDPKIIENTLKKVHENSFKNNKNYTLEEEVKLIEEIDKIVKN